MTLSKDKSITTNLFIELDRIADSTKSRGSEVKHETLKHFVKNFREWSPDSEYQKNFPLTRNFKKFEEIVSSLTVQIYRETIFVIYSRVYVKYYGYEIFGTMNIEIEVGLKSKYPTLYDDLLGQETITLVTSVGELIDHVIEGDMINALCICNLPFTCPLNLSLSPLALALAYYNQKLLTKKKIESNIPEVLPKITYISFGGFFSELDINLLDETSDNVQMIVIYEKSTSAFSIAKNDGDSNELNGVQKNKLSKLRSNMLLLPLDCSEGKISSRYLCDLFENVVNRAIRAFAPEAILISHSFNFNPTQPLQSKANPVPFSLKASTWGKILYNLCLTVNYRVIVFPHKPLLPEELNIKENDNLEKLTQDVIPIYSQAWDTLYLEECMTLSLEVLSGCKIYSKPRKMKSQVLKYNSAHEKHLEQVLGSYKDHVLYNSLPSTYGKEQMHMKEFLLSEYTAKLDDQISSNPSFRSNNYMVITQKTFLKNAEFDRYQFSEEARSLQKIKELKYFQEIIESHISNEILLFNPQEINRNPEHIQTWMSKHFLITKNKLPIFPRKESQYVVDYSDRILYYFNIFWEDKYCDFMFKIDFQQDFLTGEKLESAAVSKNRFKAGICQGNGMIFWVYGVDEQNMPTNTISLFDCKNKKWIEPKILNQRTVPRHSVSCSYLHLPKSNKHFLYVFGGISKRDNNSQIEVIHNTVEFYEVDFKKQTLEFYSINKISFFSERVSFVPYLNSYAFVTDDQILLIGGQKLATSAFETETIKTFTFNTQKQCFSKNKLMIDENRKVISCKRDSEKKLTISDSCQNVYFANGKFFILSHGSESDFLITVVSGTSTEPNIRSQAFYNKKGPIIRFSRNNAPSPNYTNLAINEQSVDGLTINIIAEEPPRTQVFLYCLTKYLNSLLKMEGAINIQTFTKIIQELVRDPLFESGHLRDIINQLLKIFPFLSQENNLRKLVGDSVRYVEQSARSQGLGKAILQNKPKDQLISKIETQINNSLHNQTLRMQDYLIVERIFLRNARPQLNYESRMSRLAFRWLTQDYSNLLTGDPSRIDYAKEDLGLLREVIINLGKILIYAQSHSGIEASQGLPIAEVEKEAFWEDPQQDKLLGTSNTEQSLLCLEVQNFSQEAVLQLLVSFLAELAAREKINFSDILNDAGNSLKEESVRKWIELMTKFPLIWNCLSERLGLKIDEKLMEKIMQFQKKREKNYSSSEIAKPGSLKDMPNKMEEEKSNEMKGEEEEYKKENLSVNIASDETPNTSNLKDGGSDNPEGRRRRRARKKFNQENEVKATYVSSFCKDPIVYHSIDNLLEAHTSNELNDYHFSLDFTGSNIEAAVKGESKRAKITLYDSQTNQLIPVFLENHQKSSLAIWNSAAYLYLDFSMSRRLGQEHTKRYESCVFYADLRQSFAKGKKTNTLALFAPVFKTSTSLMNRTIIADEAGLYLIGGTKISKGKMANIQQDNSCEFYGLEIFEELQTEILDGWMPSMEVKRDNLIIAQTKEKLYVTGRTRDSRNKDQIIVEIFDKSEFKWIKKTMIPSETENAEYNFCVLEEKESVEEVLLIENSNGREPIGHVIEVNISKTNDQFEVVINKMSNLQLKDLNLLIASKLE